MWPGWFVELLFGCLAGLSLLGGFAAQAYYNFIPNQTAQQFGAHTIKDSIMAHEVKIISMRSAVYQWLLQEHFQILTLHATRYTLLITGATPQASSQTRDLWLSGDANFLESEAENNNALNVGELRQCHLQGSLFPGSSTICSLHASQAGAAHGITFQSLEGGRTQLRCHQYVNARTTAAGCSEWEMTTFLHQVALGPFVFPAHDI